MVEMDVDHVLLGHIRGVGTAKIDGIPYTVTGGGGADITERLDADEKVHNFVLVRVTPAGVHAEVFILTADSWSKRSL